MKERIIQIQDDINELWEVASQIPIRIGADGAGGSPASSITTPGFANQTTCIQNTCVDERDIISGSCGNCSEIPLEYHFNIGNIFPRDPDNPDIPDADASSDNCCFVIGKIWGLSHTGGCRWQSELFECGDFGTLAWELQFLTPFVELKLTLDANKKIVYRAFIDDWCCLCRNGMTLVCNDLPIECGGFPCFICMIPPSDLCGPPCPSGIVPEDNSCTLCGPVFGNNTLTPKTWELTVEGINNNNCGLCNTYNGTFCLRNVGGCRWDSCRGFDCLPGIKWVLFFSADVFGNPRWFLNSNTRDDGGDYILEASLDCEGPNTFNQFAIGDDDCTDWPTTLTITPVT